MTYDFALVFGKGLASFDWRGLNSFRSLILKKFIMIAFIFSFLLEMVFLVFWLLENIYSFLLGADRFLFVVSKLFSL